MKMKKITDALEPWVMKGRRPRIAFGLQAPNRAVVSSLRRAKQYAEIILVGPSSIARINGFKKDITTKPEARLARLLVDGQVQGIVRGTVDDFTTYEAYKALTGISEALQPGLMEDPYGRQFFLATCSNPEAWAKEDKLRIIIEEADLLRSWGVRERIAIMAAVRHETFGRKKKLKAGVQSVLNQTYTDAEWVARQLKRRGYKAKNWSIDLNPAVEQGCNIIMPVNGMVGNQLFRVMLICGGKLVSIPRLRVRHFYEDNSRTEKDFESHVKYLVARINLEREKLNAD